jgi:hypothetical protein
MINWLADHDAQLLSIHFVNFNSNKISNNTITIRKINNMIINEFKIRLSFELWEDIFNDKKDDVDTIFKSFLNRYLQIFYACFPKMKFYDRSPTKSWITTRIRVSCQRKRLFTY